MENLSNCCNGKGDYFATPSLLSLDVVFCQSETFRHKRLDLRNAIILIINNFSENPRKLWTRKIIKNLIMVIISNSERYMKRLL